MELPWGDCKLAFDVNDDDKAWRYFGDAPKGKYTDLLPDGWELVETDCSGCRAVAVFRVEGIPTVVDGTKVLRLLRRFKI